MSPTYLICRVCGPSTPCGACSLSRHCSTSGLTGEGSQATSTAIIDRQVMPKKAYPMMGWFRFWHMMLIFHHSKGMRAGCLGPLESNVVLAPTGLIPYRTGHYHLLNPCRKTRTHCDTVSIPFQTGGNRKRMNRTFNKSQGILAFILALLVLVSGSWIADGVKGEVLFADWSNQRLLAGLRQTAHERFTLRMEQRYN